MTALFTDKVVLVTGAANGVGRAIAEGFAAEGGRVFATDVDAANGRDVVAKIVSEGGNATFIHADLTDDAAIARLFAQLEQAGDALDIAVNNAAIDIEVGNQAGLWEPETMDRVFSINVMGVFNCMRRELRWMERQGRGAIVNIASLAGLVGVGGKPAYTAAKHAVVGLTRAAAIQFGPAGVRVNAVCPSAIRTEMLRIQGVDDEVMKSVHPLRRIAEPSDIADAAIWLCSDRAQHITGHPLVIDAGYMAY